MRVEKVAFYNFRNIDNCSINIAQDTIFLVGKNGQGKTNFLEALYALSYASSFRTNNFRQLCKHETNEFSLSGTLRDSEGTQHTIRVVWQDNKKRVVYDDVPIKDRQDLLYIFPTVIFSYQDIQIVAGAQEAKRLYFNQILSFSDRGFVHALRRYKKILMERNRSLKDRDTSLLDLYDEQLAEYGSMLVAAREKIIQKCNDFFEDTLQDASDLTVTVNYHSAWNGLLDREQIVQHLRGGRHSDLMAGVTKTGPHCDKIVFKINGHNVSVVASTGQYRYISLLLKIFQCNIITEHTNNRPVLLLDDVLLELDKARSEEVINMLPHSEQLFFTVFDQREMPDGYANYQTIQIDNGTIF